MQQTEMERRYFEALNAIQQGKHAEALANLDELEQAAPQNKDVLHAKAACLIAMGRGEEARPLCRRLAVVLHDARGNELLARLDRMGGATAAAGSGGTGAFWRMLIAAAVSVPVLVGALAVGTRILAPSAEPPVEDTGPEIEPLANVEPYPTNLRVLNLAGNPVGDEAAPPLASLSGLERLDVSGTALSERGVALFQNISTLQYLNLGGLNVSSNTVQAIRSAAPQVEIEQ